ncbi:MAG: WD40/YVTN/BNR-like repeat-containing protein [Gemmatimonadales bacterium]
MRPARTLPLLALLAALPLAAQQPDSLTIAGMRWRNIGPANHQGRVVDVQGIPWPSRTFYVASAGGGVWKSTNAGTTFRPVFESEHVSSGGMLAIAPSDTNIVYYGTGEPNTRNSISPGAGLYKTTNGGKSWEFIGLKETEQIGRIVVNPHDANLVYVAALGHAWGPNKERGLYKSTDGGKTWVLKKFVSDKAGFVDVALDPRDPNTVWASSYERVRSPYSYQSGGPGSGLWKSTDAGETWTEVKGGGFPETAKGRISVALAASDPNIMYTLVEADTVTPHKKEAGVKPAKSPTGLYRSEDAGKTWTKMNDEDTRPFYYSQLRVDPSNANHVFWSSTPLKYSWDGGKTTGNTTNNVHVDHHAMWIDPKDPSHIIVGDDGGVAQTWDSGGNWDSMNQLPIGQYYNVSFDMAVPYNVCGGAQDNGAWCGPSRRRSGPITNSMWFTFNGGDGFVTAQDQTNSDIIYGESQGGNIGRYIVSTGERFGLAKPNWRTQYTTWEDSIAVLWPDTTKALSKDEKKRLDGYRAMQKRDSIDLDMRWNWNTPFLISKHNPQVLYFGANRVLKSTKSGDEMYPISPDLSYADTMKIHVSTQTTGGITTDATGAETFATIVSLNESPIRPGILYAGTDDGRLWMTWNDGGTWNELTKNVTGVPAGTYVSRIEPSHFDSLTFYVTYDNHRRDDFTPYVLVTTDGGKSFKSIAANLPTGGPDFAYVVREDLKNRDLLFVGTDVGTYVSTNRGQSWQRFMTGLPTTPVMDLMIHPRDNEIVAATHGRGFWIADIAPLQQWKADIASQPVHLFAPKPAFQWGERAFDGQSVGQKTFEVPSPQYGAEIVYRVSQPIQGAVKVLVQDARGDTLATLNGPGRAGIQRVVWNFRGKAAPAIALSPAGVRDSIRNAHKLGAMLDSIEKEGGLPKSTVDRIRTVMANGEGFQGLFPNGFGGGFGGGRGGFQERPGENLTPVRAARGAGAGGGRGAGAPGAPGAPAAPAGATPGAAPGAEAPLDPQEIFAALSANGRGPALQALFGFGGGNRGGPPPVVGTGDYLVSITVNGQTQKQLLHVERASGTGGGGGGFEELLRKIKK